MGGETRSVTLQTPIGSGNGTERNWKTNSGGQANALALPVTKLYSEEKARPDFGTKLIEAQQRNAPARKPERRRSKESGGFFDYTLPRDDFDPQDGESAYHVLMRKNGRCEFEAKQLRRETMPPININDAVELLRYYYLGQQKKSAVLEQPILADGWGEGDAVRAREFFSAVNLDAIRHAGEMLRCDLETQQRIEQSEKAMAGEVSRLEGEEKEEMGAIAAFYSNKGDRLVRRMSQLEAPPKPMPVFEKIKKIAIKLGIGGLLTGGSSFNEVKAAIKDVIEHIPLLASVPPEMVGMWLMGTIVLGPMLGRGIAKALAWHFDIIRGRLPMRKEKKEQKVSNRFADAIASEKSRHEQEKQALSDACEQRRKLIEENFIRDVGMLASSNGYVMPN